MGPVGDPAAPEALKVDVDVLVVDDDIALRQTTAEILRAAGYEVAEAADGAHALEALQDRTVGVILLDLHMPRVDGFELLRRLTPEDPPVIVLSAHDTAEPLGGRDGVVHAVMSKPASPIEVLASVAALLGR